MIVTTHETLRGFALLLCLFSTGFSKQLDRALRTSIDASSELTRSVESDIRTLDGINVQDLESMSSLDDVKQGAQRVIERVERREEELSSERGLPKEEGRIAHREFNFPWTWTKDCDINYEMQDVPHAHDGKTSSGYCLQGECRQTYELQTGSDIHSFRKVTETRKCDDKDCSADDRRLLNGDGSGTLSDACAECVRTWTTSKIRINAFDGGDAVSVVDLGQAQYSMKLMLTGKFRFQYSFTPKEGVDKITGIVFEGGVHVKETSSRDLPVCRVHVELYADDQWWHSGVDGYDDALESWNEFVRALRTDVYHATSVPSQYPNAPPAYLKRYDAIATMRSRGGSDYDIVFVDGIWYRSRHERRHEHGNVFDLQLLTGRRDDGGTDGWEAMPNVPFPRSGWEGCRCKIEVFARDPANRYCCCESEESEMKHKGGCFSRRLPQESG